MSRPWVPDETRDAGNPHQKGTPMATQQSEAATRHRWAAAQIAALVVGVAFLLPGVLGFVPGITTHYEMLDFAGHESGAELLGIFSISVLHNIVHRAFGIAGLISSAPSMALADT